MTPPAWDDAVATLGTYQREVAFGFAPAVLREQLRARPALAPAALSVLRGTFLDGRVADTAMLEGAAHVVLGAGGHDAAMLELAFHVARPAELRLLVPLLRVVITDDDVFERAVIAALDSEDDEVAARAIAIQYAAWGFPDRFRLSAPGAAAVAAAIARLQARAGERPAVARALTGYVVPPVTR